MQEFKIYLHNLTVYDYVGFGFVGILFLLLLIIAFIFLFKKTLLGIFILLLSFLMLPISIYGVKYILNNSIRKVKTTIKKVEPLRFINSTIINGSIKNRSKEDFKKCYIYINIVKNSNNRYKNILYELKPVKKMTILIEKSIKKGENYNFKKILQDMVFDKKKERLKVTTECY